MKRQQEQEAIKRKNNVIGQFKSEKDFLEHSGGSSLLKPIKRYATSKLTNAYNYYSGGASDLVDPQVIARLLALIETISDERLFKLIELVQKIADSMGIESSSSSNNVINFSGAGTGTYGARSQRGNYMTSPGDIGVMDKDNSLKELSMLLNNAVSGLA